MNTKSRLIGLVVLVFAGVMAHAQSASPPPASATPPPSAPVQRSEDDLEKLVAPIALYPDPLLATLLPASAYPLDIVQAARFIKDTNNISKVDSQSWDSNVKALAHFPDVIQKMNEDIAWTSDLGQAFVEDQQSVMNAIQVMRGKAQQAGNLKTTPQQIIVVTNTVVEKTVEQQVVVVTNTIVQILPAQPQVIYVPQYNPVYVYAAPTAGEIAAASVISFGVGLAVGAIIANNCNWHYGGVYVGPHGGVAWAGGYHGNVNVNVNNNYNRNVNVNNNYNRNVNQNYNQNVNQNINRNANQNATANRNLNQTQNANPNHNLNQAQTANRTPNSNVGGNGGEKWQPDASRRTSAPAASPDSRGWGGGSSSESRVGGGGGGTSAFGGGGGAETRAASARGASSRGFGGGGGGRMGGGGGSRGRR
jgi:uncharacterized membrane protein YgcG